MARSGSRAWRQVPHACILGSAPSTRPPCPCRWVGIDRPDLKSGQSGCHEGGLEQAGLYFRRNGTMNPGIEAIVDTYVKLGELDTLERMKQHRQGLLDQCVDTAHFSFDVTRSIYRSDLDVIEA